MRLWTHDELHILMDSNPALKEKSDRVHDLPRINFEEKERGKIQMMEIYAEAIRCNQVGAAREYVREVFTCLRQQQPYDTLHDAYTSKKRCHSPAGNNYLCFCDEKTA